MASKNERELTASLAMVVGLERIMRDVYNKKGGTQIWPLLDSLKKSSEKALTKSVIQLSSKDRNHIGDRVMKMKAAGFENAGSYKVYISFCIVLISDRFSELAAARSPKTSLLKSVCDSLDALYQYFDIRIKKSEYDEAAFEASEIWYKLAP